MIGYAATKHFTRADGVALELAFEAFLAMPEDGRSCHDVAALIADVIGYDPVRGMYGTVEHSWFVLPSGNILDPYAPGRFPPVQLVHAAGTLLPEASLYRRTDG